MPEFTITYTYTLTCEAVVEADCRDDVFAAWDDMTQEICDQMEASEVEVDSGYDKLLTVTEIERK